MLSIRNIFFVLIWGLCGMAQNYFIGNITVLDRQFDVSSFMAIASNISERPLLTIADESSFFVYIFDSQWKPAYNRTYLNLTPQVRDIGIFYESDISGPQKPTILLRTPDAMLATATHPNWAFLLWASPFNQTNSMRFFTTDSTIYATLNGSPDVFMATRPYAGSTLAFDWQNRHVLPYSSCTNIVVSSRTSVLFLCNGATSAYDVTWTTLPDGGLGLADFPSTILNDILCSWPSPSNVDRHVHLLKNGTVMTTRISNGTMTHVMSSIALDIAPDTHGGHCFLTGECFGMFLQDENSKYYDRTLTFSSVSRQPPIPDTVSSQVPTNNVIVVGELNLTISGDLDLEENSIFLFPYKFDGRNLSGGKVVVNGILRADGRIQLEMSEVSVGNYTIDLFYFEAIDGDFAEISANVTMRSDLCAKAEKIRNPKSYSALVQVENCGEFDEISSENSKPTLIAAAVGSVVGTAILAAVVFIILWKKRGSRFEELSHIPMTPVMLTGVTLERQIGSGAFGEVYLGKWAGNFVALKKMIYQDREEFDNEVAVLSHVLHPNIVQYLGNSDIDGSHYMAMEYMSGGSLHHLVSSSDLELSIQLDIARQCAAGMLHLSEKKIIHRDLALRNVLIVKSETVLSS
eukprot:TRINITY_DN949_c1_g1_i1.p1 TRINITY_DN949_c1_g1~~TRINITY_DN949_c1_g1_i1.p1  ORF type:complete len:631 (-),score=169.62 TRINITY_DN949_c1_g1_i1:495-2387(-)